MKKILLLGVLLIAATSGAFAQTVYTMTGNGDTISTVGTEYLSLPVASAGPLTVQFAFDRIADTVQGSAALEASVDNVDFARVPAQDTLIIDRLSARKAWVMSDNRFKFYRVAVRATKANGSGKIRGKVYR